MWVLSLFLSHKGDERIYIQGHKEKLFEDGCFNWPLTRRPSGRQWLLHGRFKLTSYHISFRTSRKKKRK